MRNRFSSRHQLYGLLTLIVGVMISAVFQSRAFMIGFLFGAIIFILMTMPGNQRRKVLYFLFGVLICLTAILILSFCFKTGSTFGRILIYKVSYLLYLDNWVKGIGYGNFKAKYPLYQALYFKTHRGNDSEIMLAGNTYYAFNDYWQFIIEGGIKSVFILLIGGMFLFLLYIKSKKLSNIRLQLLVRFIWSTLMALLVAAFFTHLWEKGIYIYIVIQLLLIIMFFTFIQRDKERNRILIITSVLLAVVIFFYSNEKEILHYRQYRVYEQAQKLCFTGYNSEGMSLLEDIYTSMKHNENYFIFYGRENMKYENYQKALYLFKEAEKIRPSNDLCRQIGICYDRLGNSDKAHVALRKSVNMVPNRFVTRYELFLFYKRHNRYKDFKEAGLTLLRLPVKVPSLTVEKIRSAVEKELKNIPVYD